MTDQAENPRAVEGDNSSFRVAADELRSFCERIERLEDEVAVLNADKKDVFAEAKGRGYDLKALRAILKLRKADKDELAEHQAIVDTYAQALGLGVFG